MVNVIVARKRTVQVSTNATAGIIDTTTPVTLKNIPLGVGVNRLDKLTDVDASFETDNATLVYNSILDKYIVKKLEFNDLDGDIEVDGGTF
jgi:hypothetical protein